MAHVPPLEVRQDIDDECVLYTLPGDTEIEPTQFARLWIEGADVHLQTIKVGIDRGSPHAPTLQIIKRRRGADIISVKDLDAPLIEEIEQMIALRVQICRARGLF